MRVAKILYFLSGIVVGAIVSRGIINPDQKGSVRYSTSLTGETKSHVLTNLNNLNSLGLYDFGEGLTHISHFNDIESPIFATFVGNNKGAVILNGGFNVKSHYTRKIESNVSELSQCRNSLSLL